MRDEFGMDLCDACLFASKNGSYDFMCDGCSEQITGTHDQVKSFLNIKNSRLCASCRSAFYGTYDLNNKAMMMILDKVISTQDYGEFKGFGEMDMSDEAIEKRMQENNERYIAESKYKKDARELTRINYKKNIQKLNPDNKIIGSSKNQESFHIDHIVPLSQCFRYGVDVRLAADVSNLQVIPYRLNLKKTDRFNVGDLIGLPQELRSKLPPNNPYDDENFY